jgi:hypothetical protein
MLKVRPEQLKTLQSSVETTFDKRIVAYLLQHHADLTVKIPAGSFSIKTLPPATLETMVHVGLERARTYGLTWQSKLVAFVILMFAVAPNFDEYPRVQQILLDEKIPPNDRIDRLWEHITDQDWETIEKRYTIGAWNLL